MKKTFLAFYDLLFCSIVSAIMLTIFAMIFIYGDFNSGEWLISHWYLIVIQGICLAVPVTITATMQRITIDLNLNKFEAFYLVNDKKNSMDLQCNWFFYPSEVESVEIVRLSKDERRKYTSANFKFDKYLKVNFKYGNSKYIYISHYSYSQRREIVRMLKRKNQNYKFSSY
jgi:hypothetical protein